MAIKINQNLRHQFLLCCIAFFVTSCDNETFLKSNQLLAQDLLKSTAKSSLGLPLNYLVGIQTPDIVSELEPLDQIASLETLDQAVDLYPLFTFRFTNNKNQPISLKLNLRSPFEEPPIEKIKEEVFIHEALHSGAVLQSYETGTTYACGILSLLSAYNATHSLRAIQIEDQVESTERPSFKTLVDFFDSLEYRGRATQPGYLFRYTPEEFWRRNRLNDEEIEEKLARFPGPEVHYSTRKIGNHIWKLGMRFLGLEPRELNPVGMKKFVFKRKLKAAFKTPNSVLMFHGFNHYTCLGGYKTRDDGGLLIQVSSTNQRPDRWVPLASLVNNLKTNRNSKLYHVKSFS